MNKLSLHNIIDIAIEKQHHEAGLHTDEFTVVSITVEDKNGTRTRLACFVEPSFTIDLAGSPLHFECDQCGRADAA